MLRYNMTALKFIHITKTGGTSIENVAKAHNVNWGRHDNDLAFLGATYWHVPFQFCDNNQKKAQICANFDLFAVVRNPYERCVSEYFCRWGGPSNNLRTAEQMNKYIRSTLNKRVKKGWSACSNKHFAPQFLYVFDGKGNRHVKHVLKFENLQQEFDQLMEQYKLPIRLTRHDNVSKKNLSVADLEPETIALIQKVYRRDFKEFGYPL